MAAAVASQNNSVFVFGGKARTDFIYQDDQCVVFNEDLEDRTAPTHFLVVPRKTIPRLTQATADDEKILGHLLLKAMQFAASSGLTGYHVMVDENHITNKFVCLHVFERALHHMLWPIGPGSRL